jgi:hypothetical protein
MKIGSAIALPESSSSRAGVRKAGSRGISVFHELDYHERKKEKINQPVVLSEGPKHHTDYYSRRQQENEFSVTPDKRAKPDALNAQKAIDFYNITAAIGNYAGEGELIGVDTYA